MHCTSECAGYLIKHHERFSPFVITDDVATSSSSLADAKVSVLLNGSQGDAGELGCLVSS